MTIASHDDAMFNAAGGELSEDTMVINNPLVDAEQMPNNPSGKQGLSRRTRIALWSSGAVLAVLLLSLTGWFFGARWYYQDKAPLGVEFGSVSVAGQNAQQLRVTVSNAVARSSVTVSDDNGKSVKANLKDLGVAVNVNQTVKNLLTAKNDNIFAKVNPFIHRNVPLNAKVDKYATSQYLAKSFVNEDNRAVGSTIAFDAESKSYSVVAGKSGKMPENTQVLTQVNKLVKEPGHPSSVKISYKDVNMPISVESAQQAADQANARVSAQYVVSNGDGKNFQIPADQIAQWITVDADPTQGTIKLQYDKQKVSDYISSTLPEQLNQAKVDQEDVVDGSGKVLLTKVKGANGVTIGQTDAVVNTLYDALTKGEGASTQVESTITKFETKQTKSEMRIVVDKSTQMAYAYRNDELVRSFPICSGKNGGNESDNGNFFIYLKYATQDMTGLNDDGSRYLSKGVKWVSYYNGGEGFHTATWNYGGIASGDSAGHGSHGCINMYEQDSKWIYENCPQGTLVQVVGSQPTGPVR